MSTSERLVIVVAATPTPNGSLHVGHVAGPYLAADIYARYARATGRPVIYTTCTDDSQSYVLTSSQRLGVPPAELCRTATAEIQRSFEAIGASMAGTPPIDNRYVRAVLEFFQDLYSSGRLRLRRVRLSYAQRARIYLYDGLLSGSCPTCLADSSGGACEECGHPNAFDELIRPRYALDPTDPVEYRECEILVLPLEEYRDRLAAYYHRWASHWRPRPRQLVDELLARTLPDVPITVPGTWGIPAPFAETPGQVLYPWIEAMPAVMYSTWWSARQLGWHADRVDGLWRSAEHAQIVFFHGFDNVYHWAVMDLALLMAHGDRYTMPVASICNEFYELAGEKFSTSRDHLILTTDLLTRVPRDLVRFYLSLTGPELQRTSFVEADLVRSVTRRLVQPWNQLSEALARLPGAQVGSLLATSGSGRVRADVLDERLRIHYRMSTFSPRRVAEMIVGQLPRLVQMTGQSSDAVAVGDLFAQVRTLLAYAAPILVDVADKLAADGVDLRPETAAPGAVPAFTLPRLPALADPIPAHDEVGGIG